MPSAACERCRQRLVDEHALLRPRDALPVGFEGATALQVVQQEQLWVRKFLQVIAGLGDGGVARGGAGSDPVECRHLASGRPLKLATKGSEVVGDRTRYPLHVAEAFDARETGLVEHHTVGATYRLGQFDMNVDARARQQTRRRK